jgi:transcriptional regulator with XRE-family HTH domain
VSLVRKLLKWISLPCELHAALAGATMISVGKVFEPGPEEIKQMLLDLRKEHRWSQGFAASVLGVSVSALSKWEVGLRVPNGAAAKLIFLLYHIFMKTGKVKNAWDLTVWGKSPCRDRDDEFAELFGTHFVTLSELQEAAESSPGEQG